MSQLGIERSDDLVKLVSGQQTPKSNQPYAMCYGGHQFGHWAGQLGDGRAIVLGEVADINQHSLTLQLKGAGVTPYSRGADGRAVLRSSVREFLCSEAMHHLGIPTTRALSLVGTNDSVMRDMLYDGHPALEPGAIVCRVAPTFLRFGSIELPASRGERTLVGATLDYLIRNHYPDIDAASDDAVYTLLETIARRTARLFVEWMRVGFVHGVLNTDNMSMHNLTIDYGPYGWLEEYDLGWTPNTTDAQGKRYAFGRQPDIGLWNLTRLGEALYGTLTDVDRIKACVQTYKTVFEDEYPKMLRGKIGLGETHDPADEQLTGMLSELLSRCRFDMTHFFVSLNTWSTSTSLDSNTACAHFGASSYLTDISGDARDLLVYWLRLYAERNQRVSRADVDRQAEMTGVNPQFVLRNYLVQQVIERAEGGDFSGITALLDTARVPYQQRANCAEHYQKMPEWARHKPGCSMLSCSS